MKLDKISIKIISELQKDGNISNQELAEKVGLSPSSCLQRVKKLEIAKIIDSYRASININKISNSVTVICEVTLNGHNIQNFQSFEKNIGMNKFITECIKVSGRFDYYLKLITASIEEYTKISDQMLIDCNAIQSIKSHVILSEIKKFTGYPIDLLTDNNN